MKLRVLALVLLAAVGAPLVDTASATVYQFQGVGTLSDPSPPYGVTDEQVTITILLDTDEWSYLPVANPIFHYFVPNVSVPVHVVGATSGVMPNVDPMDRVVALELTGEGDDDSLFVDNGATTIASFSTNQPSGFDGDLVPFTPAEMFALLKTAVDDLVNWDPPSFVNLSVNDEADIIFMDEFIWSMEIVPEPTSGCLAAVGIVLVGGFARRRSRGARRSACVWLHVTRYDRLTS